MKQLIDRLSAQAPPGRLVEVYLFQGANWEVTASAEDGKPHQAREEERQSILIAARSAWEAHTFANFHLPGLEPYKIACQGTAWVAPDIDPARAAAEYGYPTVTEENEPTEQEKNTEAKENTPCS